MLADLRHRSPASLYTYFLSYQVIVPVGLAQFFNNYKIVHFKYFLVSSYKPLPEMEYIQLIEKFYSAFKNKDAAGMIACYHDDVVFTDPAFGELKGARAKAMWEMLLSSGSDLKVEYSNIEQTNTGVKAHWEAFYTFGKKKRAVHNLVDAQFEFKDGLIIRHIDTFNLKKWAGQALGFSGKLLGGTQFFKKKLHKQTNSRLDKYMHGGG